MLLTVTYTHIHITCYIYPHTYYMLHIPTYISLTVTYTHIHITCYIYPHTYYMLHIPTYISLTVTYTHIHITCYIYPHTYYMLHIPTYISLTVTYTHNPTFIVTLHLLQPISMLLCKQQQVTLLQCYPSSDWSTLGYYPDV